MFSANYQFHLKRTFTLALPVVISQVGHILTQVADSIMVGQIGTIPLAACALAGSLFSIFMVTGLGLAVGLTPLVSQEDGKENHLACGKLLNHSFLINLLAGILLFGILYLSSFFLYNLNQDIAVVDEAISYFIIIGVSLIPMMVFSTFKQFTEGLSHTKQAMYISIGSNILNVFLNWVFIYGNLGSPAMGLEGAGWGTLLSRILMAIVITLFVFKHQPFQKYLIAYSWFTFKYQQFKTILKIGIPTSMQWIFEIGAFSGAAIIIGQISATDLAAHQIALNLAALTFMFAMGVSAATSIRVGNSFGRKDFEELRVAGNAGYILVIFTMGLFGLLFFMLNNFLPTLYIQEVDVISLAASLITIAAIFQISDGVQVVGLGILRGMGDVKIPTLITFIAYWGLALPIGYYLGIIQGVGAKGVWWGLLIGLTFAAIFLLYRFNRLVKRNQMLS